MEERLEYRMYTLVMYNLSDIQKGIQSAHAIVEYEKDLREYDITRKHYNAWSVFDKTLIVLSGGTSGDMWKIIEDFKSHCIMYSNFIEPDLNNACSAIAVLADERVWNFKKYPDEEVVCLYGDGTKQPPSKEWIESIGGDRNYFLREYLRGFRLA